VVRLVSGVLAIVALTGCAQKVWNKPGATQQDFQTDSYACEKDARQSGYFGGGLAGAINFQGFEARCMNAHGWYLEQQATYTPAPSGPGLNAPVPWTAKQRLEQETQACANGFQSACDHIHDLQRQVSLGQ
jgi:hypothetical protein